MNEGSRTIKFLFPDEKERLYHVIETDESRYHVRNKAIFLLAEYAALRASEIGLINVTDFNFTRREMYFKRLKKSKNNTLRILDDKVFTALADYQDYRLEHSIKNSCFFISQKGDPISRKTLDDLMKKYCIAADIPKEKAHFHALKHTRAVELAELGLDTKEIQYWTGHKSIKNTEIYLQFTSRQQETLYNKITYLMKNN